jgi:hypothetical protein
VDKCRHGGENVWGSSGFSGLYIKTVGTSFTGLNLKTMKQEVQWHVVISPS